MLKNKSKPSRSRLRYLFQYTCRQFIRTACLVRFKLGQMIVYKLNVPSWQQGKPFFMTTLQLKYLKLSGKISDSIAVETPLPWLHVHSHIETKFFQKFIFIKFTQSISKVGWACMGSARIPYLPSVQRIYFSTTEFFPVFVCLFYIILKKTTTLLNLQNMFRQKLLSSSVDRFTKR